MADAGMAGAQSASKSPQQITLTFPDGAQRQYPAGVSGLDIAKGISPSLAKRTVAMALDGRLADLDDAITHDAKIEFVSREDPRALELIRHDAAHVLAEAVQSLWPGTQVTIGPVIENGFYYDFYRNQPFTPEDLPVIEKKMKEIIARDKPFTREVWSREKTKQTFRDMGESFKVELVDAIPEDQSIKIYKQGDWFDLCRGPHMTSTGKVGNAFKLMKVAGAYWRGDSNNPMLTRIYGTAFAKQDELDAYLKQIEEAEKRDHRKLGREMDLFHFQEEAPGSVFWHAKGWTLFQAAGELHPPPPGGIRLRRGERAAAHGFLAVGRLRPHGDLPRQHVHDAAARGRRARLRGQADELPGPYPDFQERAEVVPRAAVQAGRVRQGAPLRAVGRAARADARARLHPGRRAYLHHRGPDRGRVAEGQRPDPVDLQGLRFRRREHQVLRPAGQAHRRRRAVGQGGSRADGGAGSLAAGRGRSTRAKAPSTGPSSNTCCATPSAATGSAAPCRSTSTCRAGSAPSISTRTPTR